MVGRGPKVGDAYIRVTADGNAVERALDNLEKHVARRNAKDKDGNKKAGNASGKAYGDAFAKQVEGRVRGSLERLSRASVDVDFSHLIRDGESIEEATERITREIGLWEKGYAEVGGKLRKLRGGMSSALRITEEQADRARASLNAWSKQAQEAAAAAQDRLDKESELLAAHSEALKENAQFNRLRQKYDRDHTAAIKEDLRRTQDLVAVHSRALEEDAKVNKARTASAEKYVRTIEHLNDVFSNAHIKSASRMRQEIADMAATGNFDKLLRSSKDLDDMLQKVNVEVDKMHNGITVVIDDEEHLVYLSEEHRDAVIEAAEAYAKRTRLAQRLRDEEEATSRIIRTQAGDVDRRVSFLGRLRGARNNFLHFIGSLAQASESLIDNTVPRILDGITDSLSGLRKAFQDGGLDGLFSLLRGGMSNFIKGGALKGGLAGLAVLVAQLILVAQVASAAAFALSGLAAAVTALAAVITQVLGAALLAALPLLGGLATGVATVAIGIDGMTEAQKKMLAPFQKWYDSVKAAVAEELFADLADQVTGVLDALGDLGGQALIDTAGRIREALSGFVKDLGSADMQATLGTLAKYLPEIAGSLASIGLDGIRGVLGIMSAIAPYAADIAEDIATAVGDWADWANSAEGKNSIADWFENAWESAKKLWEIAGLLWDILGQLFFGNQSVGKGIGNAGKGIGGASGLGQQWMDGWIEGLKKFLAFLQSPEGQKALDEWIAKAERMFQNLGTVVDKVVELFDTLNSEDGEEAFANIIIALNLIIDLINFVVPLLNGLWHFLKNTLFGTIGVDQLSGFFAGIEDFFMAVVKGVAGWAIDVAHAIVDGLIDAFLPDEIADAAKALVDAFVDAVKRFLGIASPSTVFIAIGKDIVQGLINGVLGMIPALIAAGGTLVDALVRTFEGFRDDPAGFIGDGLDNILAVLRTGALGPIPQAAATVADSIIGAFDDAPTRVLVPINQAMDNVQRGLTDGATKASKAAAAGVDKTVAEFDDFEAVPDKVKGPMNQVPGAISSALATANTGARNGVGAIVNTVSSVGGKIKAAFSGLSLYSVGANLMSSMALGISENVGKVTTAAYMAGKAAEKATKSAVQMASPSKVYKNIGDALMEGLALGIKASTGKPAAEARRAADAIYDAYVSESEKRFATMEGARGIGVMGAAFRRTVDDVATKVKKITQNVNDTQERVNDLARIKSPSSATKKALQQARADLATFEAQAASAASYVRSMADAANAAAAKQVDTVVAKLKDAKDALADLKEEAKQLRDSVAASLQGNLNLSDAKSAEGTFTTESVSSYVKSMAAKAKAFAGLLGRLRKAGIPPLLLQEIAGLGIVEGTEVAKAILAGNSADIKSLSTDFSSFINYTNQAGKVVSAATYDVAIAAQEGLVYGLTKESKQVKAAATALAGNLVKWVKEALGIKSPSRVFAEIGWQVDEGMALGIAAATSLPADAAEAMVAATVDGVNLDAMHAAGISAAERFANGLDSVDMPTVTALGEVVPGGVGYGGFDGAPYGSGGMRQVVFEAGAIVVSTPAKDPEIVANQVLDIIDERLLNTFY